MDMKRDEQIRYGAVITAAGMSTRMKRFKQLMKIGDMSFVERVVVNFLEAGVSEIVVVTGCNSDMLKMELKDHPVSFVHNDLFEETDMFWSVKLGLCEIERKADRIFFCPADVPLFKTATVKKAMATDGDIVIPSCNGKDGHPLLIDEDLIPEILSYEGDGGLKSAYRSIPGKNIIRIDVSDEGTVMDADTIEDYEKLTDLHNRRNSN